MWIAQSLLNVLEKEGTESWFFVERWMDLGQVGGW